MSTENLKVILDKSPLSLPSKQNFSFTNKFTSFPSNNFSNSNFVFASFTHFSPHLSKFTWTIEKQTKTLCSLSSIVSSSSSSSPSNSQLFYFVTVLFFWQRHERLFCWSLLRFDRSRCNDHFHFNSMATNYFHFVNARLIEVRCKNIDVQEQRKEMIVDEQCQLVFSFFVYSLLPMLFSIIQKRTKSPFQILILYFFLNTFSSFLRSTSQKQRSSLSPEENNFTHSNLQRPVTHQFLQVKISSTRIVRHSFFFIICRENRKTKRKTTNVCLCNDLFFNIEEFHHRSSLFGNETTLIRCSRSNLSSDENRRRIDEKSIGQLMGKIDQIVFFEQIINEKQSRRETTLINLLYRRENHFHLSFYNRFSYSTNDRSSHIQLDKVKVSRHPTILLIENFSSDHFRWAKYQILSKVHRRLFLFEGESKVKRLRSREEQGNAAALLLQFIARHYKYLLISSSILIQNRPTDSLTFSFLHE